MVWKRCHLCQRYISLHFSINNAVKCFWFAKTFVYFSRSKNVFFPLWFETSRNLEYLPLASVKRISSVNKWDLTMNILLTPKKIFLDFFFPLCCYINDIFTRLFLLHIRIVYSRRCSINNKRLMFVIFVLTF